jgi:dihydroflavonol-4-reductase
MLVGIIICCWWIGTIILVRFMVIQYKREKYMSLENKQTNPVMVTGATGYVAGWLVKALLEQGYCVHAPVRNPSSEKIGYLQEIADASAGSIRFFKADLLEEGSYDEAAQGCDVIFHTASPFILDAKDPQTELIEPALAGTSNVLNTVNRTESVRRVVLTSSVAAIYGDNADTCGKPVTEADWNKTSAADHNPYQYSKTLAEKAAWDMCDQQSRWDLVTINPSLVIGPGLRADASSASFDLVKQIGDGTFKTGLPDLGFCTVDVRDVAQAHYQAAFNPAAKGRYIVSGANTSFLAMAETLLVRYGEEYPIPRRQLPKFLVWLLAPLSGMTRRFVSQNVGHTLRLDNSKGCRELGINYRPQRDSMNELFQQLIDCKAFSRTNK